MYIVCEFLGFHLSKRLQSIFKFWCKFPINLQTRKDDREIEDLDGATEIDSPPLSWHYLVDVVFIHCLTSRHTYIPLRRCKFGSYRLIHWGVIAASMLWRPLLATFVSFDKKCTAHHRRVLNSMQMPRMSLILMLRCDVGLMVLDILVVWSSETKFCLQDREWTEEEWNEWKADILQVGYRWEVSSTQDSFAACCVQNLFMLNSLKSNWWQVSCPAMS